jgi:hypothetical protein
MRNWYDLNETREPWCFLGLTPDDDHEESSLTGWTLGVGNTDQLLGTESRQLHSDREEADLLVALGEELDDRRYTGTTLVTATEQTVAHLRRRLMVCDAFHSPTLRGFSHIALDDVLDRYFDVTSISELDERHEIPLRTGSPGTATTGDDPSIAVEQLWRAWTTVYRLVPPSACQGEPL